jgi:Pentapeptide repeats (8 copies)
LKTISYRDDQLPPDTIHLTNCLLQSDIKNFVAQAAISRLNPKTDFRRLDLSFADFSDCDLREFDFTGSDLRGAYGTNVKWSIGEPILKGADTSNSLFSHELSQHQYFDDHPDDLDVAQRLSADYWANTVLEVERLLQKDRGKGSGMKIARAVFDNSKDASVRTNVLLFMNIVIDNSNEHKEFIYNTLSRYSKDISVTLSCIRALSAFYASHKDAFNWLIKFLSHENQFVRSAAFAGISGSSRYMEGVADITNYIVGCQEQPHRRNFVGRVAGSLGRRYQHAVYNWSAKRYFDFNEIITEEDIRAWEERDFYEFRMEHYKLKVEAATKVYRARRIACIHRVGRAFGLSFKFDKKITTEIARAAGGPVATFKADHV